MTAVEQVRLAVRLAVHEHSKEPTMEEAYLPRGEDQGKVHVRNDVGFDM